MRVRCLQESGGKGQYCQQEYLPTTKWRLGEACAWGCHDAIRGSIAVEAGRCWPCWGSGVKEEDYNRHTFVQHCVIRTLIPFKWE